MSGAAGRDAERLLEHYGALQEEFRERAAAFYARIERASSKVSASRGLLSRFAPWEEIFAEVRDVDRIAEALRSLLRVTDTCHDILQEITASMANDQSAEALAIRKRCERWKTVLRAASAPVLTEDDAALQASRAETILRQCRNDQSAWESVKRTREQLRTHGWMAAPLQGKLARWTAELRKDEPPKDTLTGEMVAELASYGDLPKRDPIEEASMWAQSLGADQGPVRDMEARAAALASHGTREDVDRLLHDCRTVIGAFVEQARRQRTEVLERLQIRCSTFRQACPSSGGTLENEIRSLQSMPVEVFDDWTRLETRKHGVEAELDQFVRQARQQIFDKLSRETARLKDRLEGKPPLRFSVPVQKEIVRLERILERHIDPDASTEVLLDALCERTRLDAAVQAVLRSCDDEVSRLRVWRNQLQERVALLGKLKQSVGVDPGRVEPWERLLPEEEDPLQATDLPPYEDKLRHAEASMDAGEKSLRKASEQFIQNCFTFCQECERELRNAGTPWVAVLQTPPGKLPECPTDVVRLLNDFQRERDEVVFAVEKTTLEFVGSADAKLQELERFTASPGSNAADVPNAQKLERAYRRQVSSSVGGDPTYLRSVRNWLNDCEAFLIRLNRERDEAAARARALRARNERFRAEDGHKYHPGLALRVSNLLDGIPEEPRSWQSILRYQIREADRLLSCLEADFRRRVSQEVKENLEELQKAIRESRDLNFRERAEALLAELSGYGNESAPPVNLRFRLQELATSKAPPEEYGAYASGA
jgi:hypothetical protein